MTEETPIACSLGPSDLRQRLSEIAAVGADSLIERGTVGDRHLLRFRADAETRHRLEAIIAAEAKCCAFLDLSLDEQGDELVLSINAPEGWAVDRRCVGGSIRCESHRVLHTPTKAVDWCPAVD
jgi:hypothetical protein